MDLNELNELELNRYGEWPLPVKAIAILLACLMLAALGYYVDISKQRTELQQNQGKELKLRATFEKKQERAVNIEQYRAQLAEMETLFGAMLRQLPNKTEVASLLIDVSQTGLANGLEFELFQPQGEVKKDFYAELPIQVKIHGKYHDFGRFVSGLAALPRIVTIHNVSITPNHSGQRQEDVDTDDLVMDAIVKTYRYLEEESNE